MTSSNFNRRDFLKLAGLSAGVLAMPGCSALSNLSMKKKGPPNIVMIFIDDQGYADLGCFGAKGFETPNIDKMAKEGMRFTDFHVSQAVCSASRAALLTGCYSNRVDILGALNPKANHGISDNEILISEMLKEQGYATGCVGKWHLGHHKRFLPLQHGFDEYLGLPYSNDMWPVDFDGKPITEGWRKREYPQLPLIDGNEKVAEIRTLGDQDTLTTRYTERAVSFIERNADGPFFLYLAHSMVHVPLGVSDKFRGKSEQGMYGDVMMEVDWSVGEVLKALKRQGVDKDTLVIYISDNGPWLNFGNHAGSAEPLREGKGGMWEGGARVPCIMRWPGQIPEGKRCDKLAATLDVLPTVAGITGANLPGNKIDGVDILPLMRGEKGAEPRDHFFYYYRRELQCVRQGKWKLHFPHNYRSYDGVEPGMDGHPGPYAKGRTGLELYDLDSDVGEQNDVAAKHPEVVERLNRLADGIRAELGDSLTKTKGTEIRPCGKIAKKK